MRLSILLILTMLLVAVVYAQPSVPPPLPVKQVDSFSNNQGNLEEDVVIEDEKKSHWFLYTFFLILLIILSFTLKRYFQQRKYLPVISYIKINTEKGSSEEALRNALRKGGWSQKDIEKCMKKSRH